MSAGEAFEWLCAELERSTALDRLEARGTVRLTLREAGFENVWNLQGGIRAWIQRIDPSLTDY